MKQTCFLILVGLLLAGWVSVDFRPLLDEYRVRETAGQPELLWTSRSEEDVAYYEVRRRMGSERDFKKIGKEITARGNGFAYSFLDGDLYKGSGEMVEYRLFAVSEQGVEYAFEVMQISYTPTAVRRTWGSIKAMFQ